MPVVCSWPISYRALFVLMADASIAPGHHCPAPSAPARIQL